MSAPRNAKARSSKKRRRKMRSRAGGPSPVRDCAVGPSTAWVAPKYSPPDVPPEDGHEGREFPQLYRVSHLELMREWDTPPLTEEEWQQLDDELPQSGGFAREKLRGFLTGLAIAIKPPAIGDWIMLATGEGHLSDAEHILDLISRAHSEMTALLFDGKGFTPESPRIVEFCQGVMLARSMSTKWPDDAYAQSALEPIRFVAGDKSVYADLPPERRKCDEWVAFEVVHVGFWDLYHFHSEERTELDGHVGLVHLDAYKKDLKNAALLN